MAPRRNTPGKDSINPTALIMSAVLMLRYVGEFQAATNIEHALLYTMGSGVYTRDVKEDAGTVGTTAFTDAVISNLGKRSQTWQVRDYQPITMPVVSTAEDFVHATTRQVQGVDVFVESALDPKTLGESLLALTEGMPVHLKMISNRGTRVFPPTGTVIDCVDQHRCRFITNDPAANVSDEVIISLLGRVATKHRWIHVEKLNIFDGKMGYTLSQGED